MSAFLFAEYKRYSPWDGLITREKLEDAIKRFEDMGAAGISIIIDSRWGGCWQDLERARKATDLPILVKGLDFDIEKAHRLGADIVLTFGGPHISVPSLVEVHTKEQLDLALRLGAKAILTNNRDLGTGKVDTSISKSLAAWIPPDVLHVAASGYTSPAQAPLSARACLIGRALLPWKTGSGEVF